MAAKDKFGRLIPLLSLCPTEQGKLGSPSFSSPFLSPLLFSLPLILIFSYNQTRPKDLGLTKQRVRVGIGHARDWPKLIQQLIGPGIMLRFPTYGPGHARHLPVLGFLSRFSLPRLELN